MKTSLSFLLFLLLPLLSLNAQDAASAYPKAMQSALAQMQQAKTPEEKNATINTFTRIGDAMPGEWLPGYYKNLTRLNMFGSAGGAKKKDKLLEEVLAEVEELLRQHPGNSELLTLKGYHHMLYVAADPASRGAQFSGQTIQVLHQAIAANPNNPRPYLLLGQMQLGIAQFMNGSTDEACRNIFKARELYAAQTQEASLSPTWGADSADQLALRCQQ